MKLIFGTILLLLFAFLGGLHVYWLAGGKRWLDGVAPKTRSGNPSFEPPRFLTLLVALGLMGMGLLAFYLALIPDSSWPFIAGWVVAGIFLLRAIGDFRYVGFSKKVRGTLFAKRDTLIYSPLCLFISITQTVLLT